MRKFADHANRIYAGILVLLAVVLFTAIVARQHGGVQLTLQRDPEAVSRGSVLTTEDDSVGKINVNSADAEELESLPGIGPARAKAIVAYREEHGPFQSISELTNVPNIGEGILSQIKNRICLEDSYENTDH